MERKQPERGPEIPVIDNKGRRFNHRRMLKDQQKDFWPGQSIYADENGKRRQLNNQVEINTKVSTLKP